MSVYYVTVRGKQYVVEVPDPRARPVRAIVDGEVIEVNVAPAPAVAPPSPMPVPEQQVEVTPTVPSAVTLADKTLEEIKAPLPGTIVSISVNVGDRIAHGQELCVLEAMKMNNPIRANRAGVIRKILVAVGDQVQHGAPLMAVGD